ncbi:hypothetical protein P261_02184 [Lachnospiraceae bacterium TWA4]|nr:hypothetical protein P261_02184 [Lachnospiraceae bacterium TWA4]
MIELKNGLLLYHGSYCEVDTPDLNKCAKRKDFGRGFYLTTSETQAIRFLKTSIIKAVNNGLIEREQNHGYVSVFRLHLQSDLNICEFQEANIEWLHCVAAHRKRNVFFDIENEMLKYDIIGGKIADDATNATLVAYIAGVFGDMGSKEADEFCIKQLLPNKLKDQYCFRTKKALDSLEFVEGRKVWMDN